jgi:hypothetical protein
VEVAVRATAFLLAILVACSSEHVAQETGVLLSVDAPESILPRVASLRVRVHSGDPGEDKASWPERGDDTAEVEEWPAEVFIHAKDFLREWDASVWALDEDGLGIAFGRAGGEFFEGEVRRWIVILEACVDCSPAAWPAPGVDAGELDSATLGNVRDSNADEPRREAGIDASTVAPTEDAGAPRDASFEADAPRDAAADVTVPGPETGTHLPPGNTCAATPAFATTDACSQCICMRCASQVATCYASDDAAKNQLCNQVQACAMQNHCTGTDCYCGDVLCLTGGPCATIIASAASPNTVTAAADDQQSPLGRSNAVGSCSLSSCAVECGL